MMNRFFLNWKITENDGGKTIKQYLKEHDVSKASLTDIKFSGGKILVNEQEMNVRYTLNLGDELKLIFPQEEPSAGMIAENIPLDILYEDDYLLVVNKPPYMNTIPSREHPDGSLASALLGHYNVIGLNAATHIVTRLDRNTSGLVLVAKHRHIHHLFSMQQKSGRIKRTYVAVVHGKVLDDFGTINAPIGRKKDSIIEREVSLDGQYACTHFRVLHRFVNHTLVQLKLETGRTHQIRVHLSYMGHPLLGDDLYGGRLDLINRQALHCQSLSFLHPVHHEILHFDIPLPEDIEKILEKG
jgi:23S rRNA pseudouridine1911/1915/1917 synthase